MKEKEVILLWRGDNLSTGFLFKGTRKEVADHVRFSSPDEMWFSTSRTKEEDARRREAFACRIENEERGLCMLTGRYIWGPKS